MAHDYEHLSTDTVVDYLASVPALADKLDLTDVATIEEVGDGNLNLVFIIEDRAGRGVVLKQALPYVRLVGPDWPMTPERARHEHDALRAYGALAPGLVPEVFAYDPDRYILAMEDLSDHRVWRAALNDGERHDGAAAAIGGFVASVAFGTSVFGMDAEEHKTAVGRALNPELCRITEDLVFTEPYADIGRNSVEPDNEADAAALAGDTAMVAEIGLAKWKFMTSAEALVHGDLHTGSVMVRAADGTSPVSVKAIDPEFSFYGPVAFDLGALWANYVIAAARALALGEDDRAQWCLQQAPSTWSAFEDGFLERWPDRRSPDVFSDAMGATVVAGWLGDTWLFAAAKMARRIVGLAKTTDIETLPTPQKVGAARGVLHVARMAARERHAGQSPDRFGELALATLRAAATP